MQKIVQSPLCTLGGALTAYLHDADDELVWRGARPGVLVIPGGGYRRLVSREADPVAFEFFAAGFNTFILEYSVFASENNPPLGLAPLIQASHALLYIRKMSPAWNTAPHQIAVLGFSAGGHLAGSCAVLWNAPQLLARMDTKGGANRPDAAVLCYPATLASGAHHHPSIRQLCGDGDPLLFDLPSHVGGHVPPVFLWSTVEDELVPCENTLSMALRLQQHHIPYELHLYTHGRHGLTLGRAETGETHPHLASWVHLCKEWLGDLFNFAVSV